MDTTTLQRKIIKRDFNGNTLIYLLTYLEGDNENLRQLPDHFSPTSGPAGLMGYLELIFLSFQGLICRISHFCILLSCGDIVRNVKYEIFRNF